MNVWRVLFSPFQEVAPVAAKEVAPEGEAKAAEAVGFVIHLAAFVFSGGGGVNCLRNKIF